MVQAVTTTAAIAGRQRVMGRPAFATADDQMGHCKGDGPRPAQRVSEREEGDQSLDIEPSTARRLPRQLAGGSSHDASLI